MEQFKITDEEFQQFKETLEKFTRLKNIRFRIYKNLYGHKIDSEYWCLGDSPIKGRKGWGITHYYQQDKVAIFFTKLKTDGTEDDCGCDIIFGMEEYSEIV